MKTRQHSKAWRGSKLCLIIFWLVLTFIPAPAHMAFLLMDAPATVLQAHEFDLNLYIYDTFNLYGIACDVVYEEPLVDVWDADSNASGLQPDVTEALFLSGNGMVPTIMRSAMQDAKIDGILVLGLTRSGQVPGINTGSVPDLFMQVHYKAVEVGTVHFNYDFPGLLNAEGEAIVLDAATGVDVQILAFTDTAPNTPSNPDPPDGALNVTPGVILGWDSGDIDSEDVVTYKVYLDETTPPTTLAATVIYEWNQVACSAVVPTTPGSSYYWKVVATDKFGNLSAAGPIWSFSIANATATATPLPPTATPTPEPPTETPTVAPTPPPTSTPACIHDGDVNNDIMLTAADAQIAFNIALGLIVPTYEQECSADCNNNGSVTAADGQAIFYAVLGMGTCAEPLGSEGYDRQAPEGQSKTIVAISDAGGNSLSFSGPVDSELNSMVGKRGDELVVDVMLTSGEALIDAVTVDIGFCSDMLEFRGCEEVQEEEVWTEFGCNEISEGIVRMAAFSLTGGIPAAADVVLCRLTFTVSCEVCAAQDACQLSYLGVYDDLAEFRRAPITFTYVVE